MGIARGEIPERVLLPGDPQRAARIAEEFLDEHTPIAQRREYWSYRGTYRGVSVGVCSTGIGCPSAAIALEELIELGCRTFIRVGTAGAVDPSLERGDLAIFTASVRGDGTSRQYVPVEYPAVADYDVVRALVGAARARGVRYKVGIGHTKDSFYSEIPDKTTSPEAAREYWRSLQRANVLATEMESAVLFVLGQIRGVRTGCICEIIGEPVEKEARLDTGPSLRDLIPVSLEAITSPDSSSSD